ncbi:hypothetical protein RRF57_009476 [Xylaria bambusicola]|uniref:Uncharacterized protein n=1 Tax=Xylaria bambusicola TaxID=326684 RepID=A0AAN7UQZ5_9PEZI
MWLGTTAGCGVSSGPGSGSCEAAFGSGAGTTGISVTPEISGDVSADARAGSESDARDDARGIGSSTTEGLGFGSLKRERYGIGEELGANLTDFTGKGTGAGTFVAEPRSARSRSRCFRTRDGSPRLIFGSATFRGALKIPFPVTIYLVGAFGKYIGPTAKSSSHTCVLRSVFSNSSVCVLLSTIKAFFGSSKGSTMAVVMTREKDRVGGGGIG